MLVLLHYFLSFLVPPNIIIEKSFTIYTKKRDGIRLLSWELHFIYGIIYNIDNNSKSENLIYSPCVTHIHFTHVHTAENSKTYLSVVQIYIPWSDILYRTTINSINVQVSTITCMNMSFFIS